MLKAIHDSPTKLQLERKPPKLPTQLSSQLALERWPIWTDMCRDGIRPISKKQFAVQWGSASFVSPSRKRVC